MQGPRQLPRAWLGRSNDEHGVPSDGRRINRPGQRGRDSKHQQSPTSCPWRRNCRLQVTDRLCCISSINALMSATSTRTSRTRASDGDGASPASCGGGAGGTNPGFQGEEAKCRRRVDSNHRTACAVTARLGPAPRAQLRIGTTASCCVGGRIGRWSSAGRLSLESPTRKKNTQEKHASGREDITCVRAAGETRTPDLGITNASLYQLSYSG